MALSEHELFPLILFLIGLGISGFCTAIGVGGGVLFVPVLTLFFDLPVKEVIPVSALCVVVSSQFAGMRNEKTALVNFNLGLLFQVTAVVGAFIGAALLFKLDAYLIQKVFSVFILLVIGFSIYKMLKKAEAPDFSEPKNAHSKSKFQKLVSGSYIDPKGERIYYQAKQIPLSLIFSGVAGVFSGLLGVGGGVIQVPVLNLIAHIPFRVTAATCVFMVGITSSVAAFLFHLKGLINLDLAIPLVFGIMCGAQLGSLLLGRLHVEILKKGFLLVLLVFGIKMWLK